MEEFKSWSRLNKQLSEALCDELKGRITFFLTRYHDVHDTYGRAAIRLDGKELAVFSSSATFQQEYGISALYRLGGCATFAEAKQQLKPKWDAACTYSEMDFLDAALRVRNMTVQDALASENYILKILGILDKRVGQRTLSRIAESGAYKDYPDWVRQFYTLRLSARLSAGN